MLPNVFLNNRLLFNKVLDGFKKGEVCLWVTVNTVKHSKANTAHIYDTSQKNRVRYKPHPGFRLADIHCAYTYAHALTQTERFL